MQLQLLEHYTGCETKQTGESADIIFFSQHLSYEFILWSVIRPSENVQTCFIFTAIDSVFRGVTLYPQHKGYESTTYHSRDPSQSLWWVTLLAISTLLLLLGFFSSRFFLRKYSTSASSFRTPCSIYIWRTERIGLEIMWWPVSIDLVVIRLLVEQNFTDDNTSNGFGSAAQVI